MVILLEVGTTPDGVSNALFEASYEGMNNDQISGWSSRPGMGHYRWLKGPINYLQREQRSEYVANTIRRILDFIGM